MSTQADGILNWLLQGRTITQLEAIDQFGCTRLAARIDDLRKRGYHIQMHRVQSTTNPHIYYGKYLIPFECRTAPL
jgi:Helix-turn-helix domain